MSFIDWSDPEAMLSLLVEYVEDERGDCGDDARRRRLLDRLVAGLSDLETRLHRVPDDERCGALRDMAAAIDAEFDDDPVAQHLRDCAEELERIGRH
ncbi:MAG TPA: hypothetical protein VJ724_08645 [Tahibacter sp.]|nr:hypothetical protein [Tahibacter sp.]